MPRLDEETRHELKHRFRDLSRPVTLVVFDDATSAAPVLAGPGDAAAAAGEMLEILREVAEHSDRIAIEPRDLRRDASLATRYALERAPSLVVEGERDYGIRFYGIPSGFEFETLIEAIRDVSRGSTDLAPELKTSLSTLRDAVHIRVFTTPTCPHCPRAVRAAHKLALESDLVRADCIDATEFPDLARQHGVAGVPRTLFNDRLELVGAAPDEAFVERVLAAGGGKGQAPAP